MAEAGFLGPQPFPNAEVNHEDSDRTNARSSNLNWKSRLGNQQHSWRAGFRRATHPRGEKHGMSKLTAPQIHCIRVLKGLWTQRQAAKHFGVSQRTIMLIVTNRAWKHVE